MSAADAFAAAAVTATSADSRVFSAEHQIITGKLVRPASALNDCRISAEAVPASSIPVAGMFVSPNSGICRRVMKPPDLVDEDAGGVVSAVAHEEEPISFPMPCCRMTLTCSILARKGTPLVLKLTRLDTGPCRLFTETESQNPSGLNLGRRPQRGDDRSSRI